MNIAFSDDLQQLLRRKVENGQFPDEAAVVREAVRIYLTGEVQERLQTDTGTQGPEQRTPGPFLADDMVLPPVTLPTSGVEGTCSCRDDAMRWPDRFPGE
jgi:Arc/MetJ-type ribon-helix-helix transcriptional regulator